MSAGHCVPTYALQQQQQQQQQQHPPALEQGSRRAFSSSRFAGQRNDRKEHRPQPSLPSKQTPREKCRWPAADENKMSPHCRASFFSSVSSDARNDEADSLPAQSYMYDVCVIRNGDAVAVCFPIVLDGAAIDGGSKATEEESETDFEESTFDAAWLWSNCPSAVLPASGQKARSPGEFPGWRVASASVVEAYSAEEEEEGVEDSILPIPPPPPGSCHPILVGNLIGHSSSRLSAANGQILLRITWDTGARSEAKSSATSYFDMDWLGRWRYDDTALRRRRARTEVTPDQSIGSLMHCNAGGRGTDSGLVEVRFDDIASGQNQDELFTLFQAIFYDGAALVRNAPCNASASSTPVAVVGRALGGSLSHGALYGDVFHVKATPAAVNIAYTSLPCRPHQDLAYYESMPGIQLLHCVNMSPTIVGGESVLIDCMAAAEEFRRVKPDYFRTLVTCPATFVKQRKGACMTYLRPHIVLKEGPDLNDMDREIVGVNWSPPFEGPLCVESDQVRSYYKAYAAFERMLDNSLHIPPAGEGDGLLSREESIELSRYAKEHTWERKLEPGDMLVFSNRRLLHGRRGFVLQQDGNGNDKSDPEDDDNPGRHLVGCYTNIDDSLNRYRDLLQEKFLDASPRSIMDVGNGTSLIP